MRIERDPVRVALLVLLALAVSRIHQQVPALAQLRPSLVLTMLAAGYAALNPRLLNKESVVRFWPGKIMAMLGVMACLSVPFGVSMGGSGKFILEVYSKNLVLAFLVIAATRRGRDLYSLAWGYVIGSGLLCYTALFVYPLYTYKGDFGYARLAGLVGYDANDVGCVLMIGLALTLLVMRSAGTAGKVFCVFTLVGIGGTVARSGSRGGLIGLVATGAALLLMISGVSVFKRVIVVVVAVAALAFWAPPGYWRQMQTISDAKSDYNWTSREGRMQLAQRGIGYMWEYPVFGVGINNFPKMECLYSDKAQNNAVNTAIRCTAPHNSYVQAGAELGVPGIVLWAGMLLLGIPGMLLLRARLPRRWERGDAEERFLYAAPPYLAVACVGFAVTSFFLSFAWLEIYYILGAMMASLYASVDECQRRTLQSSTAAPPTAPMRRRGTHGFRTAPLPGRLS